MPPQQHVTFISRTQPLLQTHTQEVVPKDLVNICLQGLSADHPSDDQQQPSVAVGGNDNMVIAESIPANNVNAPRSGLMQVQQQLCKVSLVDLHMSSYLCIHIQPLPSQAASGISCFELTCRFRIVEDFSVHGCCAEWCY